MKTFITDYWALNEVGRLCHMGGEIEAETLEDAKRIAKTIGHVVLGELMGEEEWEGGGDFCDRIMRERDEEWLNGTS